MGDQRNPEEGHSETSCAATKRDGETCGSSRVTVSGYCFAHDPESVSWRAMGGKATARKRRATKWVRDAGRGPPVRYAGGIILCTERKGSNPHQPSGNGQAIGYHAENWSSGPNPNRTYWTTWKRSCESPQSGRRTSGGQSGQSPSNTRATGPSRITSPWLGQETRSSPPGSSTVTLSSTRS